MTKAIYNIKTIMGYSYRESFEYLCSLNAREQKEWQELCLIGVKYG